MNDVLKQYLMSFLGVPYRWGGSGFGGIDCSGLAIEYIKAAGLNPPFKDATAQGIYNWLLTCPGKSETKAGAFVFYGKNKASISHITIMVDDFYCIGANGGTSSCITWADAVKLNAFVKIRPYNYRADLVDVFLLT